jgi:hypothetical protein
MAARIPQPWSEAAPIVATPLAESGSRPDFAWLNVPAGPAAAADRQESPRGPWRPCQRTRDNGRMTERLEAQRAVAAPATEIFSVLSDPRGHVAIDSSGMLMDASGDVVGKVGDTFIVHMDREALNDYPLGLYDVTVEIVTFERDREIAWTIRSQRDIGHIYGYRLEPIDEGTLVTSYYDWSGIKQDWKDAGIFPVIPESALRATLGILARTVAPGRPRPAIPDRA